MAERFKHSRGAAQLRTPDKNFRLQVIQPERRGTSMTIDRRTALMLGLGAGASTLVGDLASAQAKDSVTIGWPSDVPSWDPNQRFTPDAQPIARSEERRVAK